MNLATIFSSLLSLSIRYRNLHHSIPQHGINDWEWNGSTSIYLSHHILSIENTHTIFDILYCASQSCNFYKSITYIYISSIPTTSYTYYIPYYRTLPYFTLPYLTLSLLFFASPFVFVVFNYKSSARLLYGLLVVLTIARMRLPFHGKMHYFFFFLFSPI